MEFATLDWVFWFNNNGVAKHEWLARIGHRFGNEGDFSRPERFSESFDVDSVRVE